MSEYDIPGIKFGSARLSINRSFDLKLPENCKIQMDQGNYYSESPLIVFSYENTNNYKIFSFMWAGETETIEPGRIDQYIGFCRIQGNIQHLIILK